MKEIPLTKGFKAIVDDEDYEYLMQWSWYYKNEGYAVRKPWCKVTKSSPKTIMMHRVIMNPPDGMEVDHININGLDNRRCNLRIATRTQNQRNLNKRIGCSSKYKGVYWSSYHNLWKVEIKTDNGKRFVGSFKNEESAGLAYNEAAKLEYGEFYKGNII